MITDKEYEEYQQLKNNALIQRKFDAVREVRYLENDIDAPIKLLVSMLALLRCKTRFSCCGFDYDGQPLYKTHEYGVAYIQIKEDTHSIDLMTSLENDKTITRRGQRNENIYTHGWHWYTHNGIVYLVSEFNKKLDDIKYPWTEKRTCIHYSEQGALAIDYLEKALWTFREHFVNSIVLFDSNGSLKDVVHSWQYPALEPWVINKKTVFEQYNSLHKRRGERDE